MTPLVDVLKELARPASVTFTIVTIAVGIALAFTRRTAHLARWYFTALLAGLWLVASPAVSERLIEWQSGDARPIASAAAARGARTIVVLGAGNATYEARGQTLNQVTWVAALRLLEAARVYVLLDHPTIIVSGGVTGKDEGARPEAEAMRTVLVELGVPSDRIVLETESKTTRDEAIVIARMLADRSRQPIVLVTSPTHMPRSVAVFKRAGLDPVPAVAMYKSEHSLERRRWLPSDSGLLLFDQFLYDFAATAYYRLRGWID